MVHLVRFMSALKREESGQDLIEYALLVSLIALAAVIAVTAAGGRVNAIFQSIVSQIPA